MKAGIEKVLVRRVDEMVDVALVRGEVVDMGPGCKFGMAMSFGATVTYRAAAAVPVGDFEVIGMLDILAWEPLRKPVEVKPEVIA